MVRTRKRRDSDEVEVWSRIRRGSGSRLPAMSGMRAALKFPVRAARFAFGAPNRLDTLDRKVLEEEIFPEYTGREDVGKILFVGCGWYTRHYEKEFFGAKEFWTIDPSSMRAIFGAKRHVPAPLEHLDRYFPERFFDWIICNGVFGHGLDGREDCDLAFERCYRHLRDGGELLLGWDDVPEKRPFPPDSLDSLKRFRRNESSCLGRWRCRTDTAYRHIFDFYVKGPSPTRRGRACTT